MRKPCRAKLKLSRAGRPALQTRVSYPMPCFRESANPDRRTGGLVHSYLQAKGGTYSI